MKTRFMKNQVYETQVCKIVIWEQEQTSNPALRASQVLDASCRHLLDDRSAQLYRMVRPLHAP
jgi:hypothetical protein